MGGAIAVDSETTGFRNLVTQKLKGREFFGHPAGLFVLFFTEMWERFSYYGMRALLVLYMTKYLLFDPERARTVLGYTQLEHVLTTVFGTLTVQAMSSQIYGLYTALVYLTPLFGGYIADKVWGQHKTVYAGGALMAIGHFLMASEKCFFIALLFIILGNGCFKPNISTQVGSLYKDGDRRRDGAFTIFYMGVNLGAFLAPFICGTLGQTVGWHYGFGAAGVGMILGLIVYWLGSGLVPKDFLTKASEEAAKSSSVDDTKRPLTKEEWRRIAAIGILAVFNIVFWAIYEQQGNTLQIWADQRTNWSILGFTIPSSWYQAFNPAFIFIFAPLLDMFWAWQAKRGKEPSSILKMGIGCFVCGIAYVIMIAAAQALPEGERGSVMWLISTTWLFTMGELYLSPIGLSFVTKVSPKPIVSMMMGLWYLAVFFGNYLAGYLGMFYDKMSKEQFFAMLTVMGVLTGFIFFLIKKPMSRTIASEV